MRGLLNRPSQSKLLNSYNLLQSKAHISEKKIILFSQWSRFDPRLGEILIEHLSQHWLQLNPLKLRQENLSSEWPQALAVILEHVKNAAPKEAPLFLHFYQICIFLLEPAPYQSFSVGLFRPGGQQNFKHAMRPHPFFKKWGYYESTPLYSKFKQRPSETFVDRKTRKQILGDLLKEKKALKVNDYLEACCYAIHRRQAERDLKSFFKLKTKGNTRARVYSF